MDATFAAIAESQWMLCLFQITLLMSICWLVGRLALQRFPDITASVGVVGLLVSAGLIALTWANVPRPFELNVNSETAASVLSGAKPIDSSVEGLEAPAESPTEPPSWLSKLTGMLHWGDVSDHPSAVAGSTWQWVSPLQLSTALLWLTLLGGLVGVFRVILSSKTIYDLARSSSPVDDAKVQAEVIRIVDLLPIGHQQRDIPVRQFNGPGSPFVSWLTGRTIYVPESFLNWSEAEQSVSLAHEIGHLQRRDHCCRIITQLTFCLTWLHPLAWILHRQTLLAQELAADQVAAQATHNPTVYCRGLSRLALRFDAECRHPSALGVSVSSSLIRRITMLKEIDFYRLPCSQFVNRCITLFAFIACTWIGCWSVSGQTTQEEHSDSKVVTASHTAPVKMFSQPTSAPWEVLGNRLGYLKVDVSQVVKHPYASFYLPEITAELNSAFKPLQNEESPLEHFGLSLEEVTQIQCGIVVSHNSISMSSTMEVTADNPVDWPSVIKALDLESYCASVEMDLERFRNSCLDSAEMGRTYLFKGEVWNTKTFWKKVNNILWESPTETMKTVWEAVSGGAVTIVYDLDSLGEVPEGYSDLDRLDQATLEMVKATEIAAWGVDLSEDYTTFQVRFAAVPKDGVSTDDLIEKFEALKVEVAAHTDDDVITQILLTQFMKAKATTVEGKLRDGTMTKAYLFIEGECTIDFAEILKGRQP